MGLDMSRYFKQRMTEIRSTPKLIKSTKSAVFDPKAKEWRPASPEPVAGTRRGYIYFAMCGKLVKIGFATSVYGRIAALNSGNVNKLSVQEVFHSYFEAKKMVHDRFAKDRVRGDWFRLTWELEELWNDIWDFQGGRSWGSTGREHLDNMQDVFFELDDVAHLLSNISS